jgi:acyl-CoA thioesterase-1
MPYRAIIFVAAAVALAAVLIFGARLLHVRASIGSYREYWNGRAGETRGSGDFIYVALGDSTAQGIGASAPEKGYVGRLAGMIESTTGRTVRVINLSVSGATVRDLIDVQLPRLDNLPPADLVTVSIGANDLAGSDPKTFEASFDDALRSLPKGTVVATMPAFGGRKSGLKQKAADYARLMDGSIAASGLTKADVHVATTGLPLKGYAADLFHPSDFAYGLWADAFWQAVGPTLHRPAPETST